MIVVATLIVAMTLAEGRGFASAAAGANKPLGTQVLVAAFRFDLVFQLGNGCGSDTQSTLDGGSTRIVAAISLFCVGSFGGSRYMQWWNNTSWIDAVLWQKLTGQSPRRSVRRAAALCIGLRHWERDKYSLRKGFAWQRLLHGNLPLREDPR